MTIVLIDLTQEESPARPVREAKLSALPKIKAMANAGVGLHHKCKGYAKNPNKHLKRIVTKKRATEILRKFDDECTFVSLHLKGSNELTPGFLNIIFGPCNFQWRNVFVWGQKEREVKGYMVAQTKLEAEVIRHLLDQSGGRIVHKGRVVDFVIRDMACFRSMLCNGTLSEYPKPKTQRY